MTDWCRLRPSFAAFVVLIVTIVAMAAGNAQQPPPTTALDGPLVLNMGAGRVRVVPLKGLVYPWALACLPNGDMLVTEQNRTTLRIIRGGVNPHRYAIRTRK